MAKSYQYWPTVEIRGGYPGELKGSDPDYPSPITTTALSGEITASYFYLDSDAGNNNNSSQVNVQAVQSWTATIDELNNLDITINTSITGITRNNIKGVPNSNGWTRTLRIGQYQGGPVIKTISNDPINTAHTISGAIDLGEYKFSLAPGEDAARSAIYIFNYAPEYSETQGIDHIYLGVRFINTLPKDYRPGMVWNGSNWMSCNRSTGVCQIWNGTAWEEMRTLDGGVGTENPPLSYNGSEWVNQSKIGQE